jgi:hypothetical protein
MPVLEYAIPCQLISIDQRTNAVSLFNIIESLEVIHRPGEADEETQARSLFPMEVVSLWRRLPTDSASAIYTQILTFTPPSGNEEEVSQTDFQIPHFRHRVHVQLPPLAVDQEGDYVLKVYLGSAAARERAEVRFEYPIRVVVNALPIVIELLPEELQYLQRPVSGQGGFQSLLRRLQNQVAHDRLVLSVSDAERLLRYATQYGQGGFQDRLRHAVEQVRMKLAA